MASPAIGSPAYNNQSNAWELITTDFVTVITAFILVLSRLYTKYFLTKSAGWEDACSVLALLIAIGRLVGDCLGAYQHYLGRHINVIPKPDLDPLVALVATDGILYIFAITFAKFSILLFLYRIFKVIPKFRYASWAIGAIAAVWALVTFLLVIFACKPVGAIFSLSEQMAPTTVCKINGPDVENIFGFCNIIIDVILLIMPMPLLWTLHMTRAKKIGVSIVFANGAVICAIAIVRQYMLYTLPFATDPAWQIINIKIWMTIEVNLAIICGCLPVLQPLFRKIPLLSSHIRSKITGSHSTLEHASWPKQLTGPRQHNRLDDDVERGASAAGRPKAPWREPDELSDSGTSSLTMYHLQQQHQQEGPALRSALEPDTVRMDDLGAMDKESKGVAM